MYASVVSQYSLVTLLKTRSNDLTKMKCYTNFIYKLNILRSTTRN